MTRRAIAIGCSLGSIVILLALGAEVTAPGGRDEVGAPVRGVVALVQSSSPENDLFNGQFCAGVLLDPGVVVTGAHCVGERKASSVDAVVGADNLCSGRAIDGVRIPVLDIEIDPRYDASSGSFDLARLTLASAVGRQSVRDTQIAPRTASRLLALGWGSVSVGGPTSCRLMQTRLRPAEEVDCVANTSGTDHRFDPETMICAYPTAYSQDTCTGDSGGPLIDGDVNDGLIVAIVSWGIGCGIGHPGVYARVRWP